MMTCKHNNSTTSTQCNKCNQDIYIVTLENRNRSLLDKNIKYRKELKTARGLIEKLLNLPDNGERFSIEEKASDFIMKVKSK